MIGEVTMRPFLLGVIAGVPHDRNTPLQGWTPTTTAAHPAKTMTFSTVGVFAFRVPSWVRSITRTLFGGGGGGGGFDQGGGGGVGGWCCTDVIEVLGGENWSLLVGAGGAGGAPAMAGVGGSDSRINGSTQAILAPGGAPGPPGDGIEPVPPTTGTSGSVALGSVIRTGGGGGGNDTGTGGGGGGSTGSPASNGVAGGPGIDAIGGAGGTLVGAGSGGDGGTFQTSEGQDGVLPGGGGGGASDVGDGGDGAQGRIILSWSATE